MRKSCLVWSIELIDDTNRTGSAEFVVPAAAADNFFPIEVRRRLPACLPALPAYAGTTCPACAACAAAAPVQRHRHSPPACFGRTHLSTRALAPYGCPSTPPPFALFILSPPLQHPAQAPPPLPVLPAPQVEFGATKTICDVRVDSVLDARSGQPVKYGSRTTLVTEGYHVE